MPQVVTSRIEMATRPGRWSGRAVGHSALVVVVGLLLCTVGEAHGERSIDGLARPAQPPVPLVAWANATPGGASVISAPPSIYQPPLLLNLSAEVTGGSPPYHALWMPGDGSSDGGLTVPYVLITPPGFYRVALTLTDSATWTTIATTAPFVAVQSLIETGVEANANVTFGPAPLAVGFTGRPYSGSADHPAWNFSDGAPAMAGWNVSHTYARPGSYAAVLNATTPGGSPVTYTTTILVAGTSEPPIVVANATATSGGCGPGDTRFFKVNLSSEAAGGAAPYQYEWFFGDGFTGTGATVTHQYTNDLASTIVPRVRVVDSQGAVSTSSVPVRAYGPDCGHPIGFPMDAWLLELSLGYLGLLGATTIAVGVWLWRRSRPPRPSSGSPIHSP
ncbi:MAG: PKD domain-containing protein [Thermoplasmata archaeon]